MIVYLIQTILVCGLLTFGYYVFFKNSTQFQLRRFIVIVIPFLSLLIPLAYKISYIKNPIDDSILIERMLNVVEVSNTNQQYVDSQSSFVLIFTIVYGVFMLFFSSKLVLQIRQILFLKGIAECTNGIFITKNSHQAFSFFNSIYIPKNQETHLDIIVKHETVHKEQFHSLDTVFYEVLKVVFWINPFIYLLKKELSSVHEFIVDQKLIQDNTNINEYCEILMQSGPLRYMAIGNNFRNSLTKIRFIMMTKSNNRKSIPIRILGMLAITMAITMVFHSCNQEGNDALNHDEDQVVEHEVTLEHEQQKHDAEEEEAVEIEVYPSYPGGNEAMSEFLGSNIVYPEIAKENGIQGNVYVQFVIDKEGQLTNVKVSRGVSPEIDAEAIRVISSMPNWSPAMKDGKPIDFAFTIPLKFILDEEASE